MKVWGKQSVKCSKQACHRWGTTFDITECRHCKWKDCEGRALLEGFGKKPKWGTEEALILAAVLAVAVSLLAFGIGTMGGKQKDDPPPPPPPLVVEPSTEEVEAVRMRIREDVEGLVVAGTDLVKKHRALALARKAADDAVADQAVTTQAGRADEEAFKRAKQIHLDGSLFEEAGREKEAEIRDIIQNYLKLLERLAKAEPAVVEEQMTAEGGAVAGVDDKELALGMARQHLAETRRYSKPLDHMKVFKDFKNASVK